MYLSRLSLQISAPGVRQSLRNCQDMHRTIMKAFDCSREEAQVLYRVIKTDQKLTVYVQSKNVPRWERIESSGFYCEKQQDISALFEAFTRDRMFRFSLIACPTKKVKSEGKNSRRVLLQNPQSRIEWLVRQGEKNGFAIVESHETGKEVLTSGNKEKHEFFLTGVPFEGILKITEPESFCRGFLQGIGPEKSYGFGMLMIGRI